MQRTGKFRSLCRVSERSCSRRKAQLRFERALGQVNRAQRQSGSLTIWVKGNKGHSQIWHASTKTDAQVSEPRERRFDVTEAFMSKG
jgi:hypothetical protein